MPVPNYCFIICQLSAKIFCKMSKILPFYRLSPISWNILSAISEKLPANITSSMLTHSEPRGNITWPAFSFALLLGDIAWKTNPRVELTVFFIAVMEDNRDIWSLFRFKNEPRFYMYDKITTEDTFQQIFGHNTVCRFHTRKNAQVVTGLQTSCYKSVHKLSTSCVRTACCCNKFGTNCWQLVTSLMAL